MTAQKATAVKKRPLRIVACGLTATMEMGSMTLALDALKIVNVQLAVATTS